MCALAVYLETGNGSRCSICTSDPYMFLKLWNRMLFFHICFCLAPSIRMPFLFWCNFFFHALTLCICGSASLSCLTDKQEKITGIMLERGFNAFLFIPVCESELGFLGVRQAFRTFSLRTRRCRPLLLELVHFCQWNQSSRREVTEVCGTVPQLL